ncbi:tetratricopeptide repeat protein, partial [candidate division WOR-3 bacterium]|nr:tetratricopeptide repeat protein [candidate division WOR-3 bacterium]
VFIWLGITYEKKEEKDKALLFFKKALEVNPDNGWAKHLIEEMK